MKEDERKELVEEQATKAEDRIRQDQCGPFSPLR